MYITTKSLEHLAYTELNTNILTGIGKKKVWGYLKGRTKKTPNGYLVYFENQQKPFYTLSFELKTSLLLKG